MENHGGGRGEGAGGCADNVTKTFKCTTLARLFAKSRGRVEARRGAWGVAEDEGGVRADLSPSA